MKAVNTLMKKVYALNSQTGTTKNIKVIPLDEHKSLLHMQNFKSCPLENYKFTYSNNATIVNELSVDTDLNITVKTDKPMKKSISVIGTMPMTMVYGQCNSVIKENKFDLEIEVCGYEKVELTDAEKGLNYTFVIDKEPKEEKLAFSEIKAMFKGGSTNCPINKYTIVKSNVTNEEYHIADDIWDHLTFDGSQLQPSMKLSNIIKKE